MLIINSLKKNKEDETIYSNGQDLKNKKEHKKCIKALWGTAYISGKRNQTKARTLNKGL